MAHHFYMPLTNSDISCAIIAGGKSSRFGSNKALSMWDASHSVIGSVIRSASRVTDRIMIIAGDHQAYRALGLPIHPDLLPGYGPVSGIHTALSLACTDRVIVLACDMPAVSSRFLNYLISLKSWAPVVVPVSGSGPEPLHAIWHRSLAPLLENSISRGSTGLRHLLSMLPCRYIAPDEIISRGLDPLSLVSVNTPEALELLRQKVMS